MEENKQNKKSGSWIIVIILAIIVFAVSFTIGKNEIDKGKVKLNNSTMSCEYNQLMGGWYVEIIGTIENETNSKYSYMQVEFSLYDNFGNNVGSAFANMNNLGAGERWSFKAESLEWFDVEVKSYKLADISYW